MDLAILRCLQTDARLSLRDVAKRVGVSTPTVSSRLASLRSLGIVRGFVADVDPGRLRQASVSFVVRARLPAADAVAEAIARHAWARRVAVARSGRIVVEATVTAPETVDGILRTLAAIQDVVEAEHFVAVRTVKDAPLALIPERAGTDLTCFECHGPIAAEPLRSRLDGREAFFCCRSCQRLFLDRYAKTKAAAGRSSRGPHRTGAKHS